MMDVAAQAINIPSKVILFGEHAVVYGTPGIACAADLYSTVVVSFGDAELIQISINEFSYAIPVKKFVEFYRIMLDLGIDKATEVLKGNLRNVIGLLYMLGKGIEFLNIFSEIKPLRIVIVSPVEPGSGLGYSAGFSAGIVLGLSRLYGTKISAHDFEKVVSRTEEYFHGNPSGIDQSAVLEGGFFEFNKKEGVVKKYTSIHSQFKKCILVNTGKPQGTTKEAIMKAQKYFDIQGSVAFDALFVELQSIICKDNFEAFLDIIRKNQRLLSEIGVSSCRAEQLAQIVEKSGGAIKITGAGTVKGEEVGMMIAFHTEMTVLENIFIENELEYFSVHLGVNGILDYV